MLKASFKARGQAGLDRLDQDETQKLCSEYANRPLPASVAEKIEQANLATIRYPADGKLVGDWKNGEKIAQERPAACQFSDDPKVPAGANCYACHQLTPQELSYGTIGPSLYRFGKVRGLHRRDAQVRVRQDLQRRGVRRVLEHAALRPQPHPDRAADQGRRRAAGGPGVAGQQVTAGTAGAARDVVRGRLAMSVSR